MSKIVFVTFADNKYKLSLKRIEDEARSFSCFSEFYIFREKDIDDNFLRIINPFIYRRGFGYWRWKPYFVNKVFDELDKGDVLIWADAGCVLNPQGESLLLQYISNTKTEGNSFFVFSQNVLEKEYTKNDLFEYLECGDDIRDSEQIWAGSWIAIKDEISNMVLKEWLQICQDRGDLIMDGKSITPNGPLFKEHRWDQSVFSILVKKSGHFSSIPYNKEPNSPILGSRFKELSLFGRTKQLILIPWRFILGCYLKYYKGFYFRNKIIW